MNELFPFFLPRFPRITLRRTIGAVILFATAFFIAILSSSAGSSDVSAYEQATNTDNSVSVVDFLDVGQGSSTLIRFSDGKTLLIDTGPKSARANLLGYLESRDIQFVDCMVLTHQHGDHTDNALAVLDQYEVGDIWMPDAPKSLFLSVSKYEELYREIADRGYALRNPIQGEVILQGPDYRVTVLSEDAGDYIQLNDYSIVLRVEIGDVVFLLMADGESFVEKQLLEKGAAISADVISVGHHGNYAGTTEEFLAAVKPRIAVISVGVNTFGQPNEGVIDRLDRSGCSVFRTDVFGTVTVTTDGDRLFLDYGEDEFVR